MNNQLPDSIYVEAKYAESLNEGYTVPCYPGRFEEAEPLAEYRLVTTPTIGLLLTPDEVKQLRQDHSLL